MTRTQAPTHLLFARNTRVHRAGRPDDILQLGRYCLEADGTARFYVWNYTASRNMPPLNTRVRHPSYGLAHAPLARAIQYPQHSNRRVTPLRGTWEMRRGLLEITLGTVIQTWRWLEPRGVYVPQARDYVLDGHGRRRYMIRGVEQRAIYGFACATTNPSLTVPVRRSSLYDTYSGIEHTLISGGRNWCTQGSNFSVGLFKMASANLMTYSKLRSAKGMYEFRSFLFNYFPNKAMLISDGGYDFNRDKAANEPMHTFLYWLSVDGHGRVPEMVGIQHFRQDNGYPILSCVHYKVGVASASHLCR
jgi:hypothetical protein